MTGKEKCMQSDNIPPEPKPKVKHQQDCLLNLRQHLKCSCHLIPGHPVYCQTKPGENGSPGRHLEVTHEEMKLWAKHIVSKMIREQKNECLLFMHSQLAKQRSTCPQMYLHMTIHLQRSQGTESLRYTSPSTLLLHQVCYILTECLPDLGKGALMVTDTHYNFCTPDEKGGNCCQ